MPRSKKAARKKATPPPDSGEARAEAVELWKSRADIRGDYNGDRVQFVTDYLDDPTQFEDEPEE